MSTFKTFQQTVKEQIDIVSDEFSSPTGEWDNYITYPSTDGDLVQYNQIKNQKHTDIRSFFDAVVVKRGITFMSEFTMDYLSDPNGQEVGTLDGFKTILPDENWQSTAALTTGKQSDRHNWWGVTVPCSSNATTTFASAGAYPVDLSSYSKTFEGDYISVSCPEYPIGLKKSASSIEFSSSDSFESGNTDVISLNNPDVSFTNLKVSATTDYSSLSAYWRLEESIIVNDEVVIADELGNSDGSLKGTFTTSGNLDKLGAFQGSSSIYFDGSTNYIDVPSNSSINFDGSFTISVWVKPTDTPSSSAYRIIGNYITDKSGYEIGINTSLQPYVTVGTGSNHSTRTATNPITVNTWNLITVVYNASANTLSLYVNGSSAVTAATSVAYKNNFVEYTTGTVAAAANSTTITGTGTTFTSDVVGRSITIAGQTKTITARNSNTEIEISSTFSTIGFANEEYIISGSDPLKIGRNYSNTSSTSFKGYIDEVALFSTALTGTQITALYNTCKSSVKTDVEIKIPLYLLEKSLYYLDNNNVKQADKLQSIRFNVYNQDSSNFNFRCVAIRCFSTDWKYSPIDINTQTNTIGLTPTPTGAALTGDDSLDFASSRWPRNSNVSHLPLVWPALYRSFADNASTDDVPNPIDGKMQIIFDTGSMLGTTSSAPNEAAIYFRSTNQIVSNDVLNTKTQLQLDAVGDLRKYASELDRFLQKDHSVIRGTFPITRSTPAPISSPYLERQSPSTDFKQVPIATTLSSALGSSDTSISLTDSSGLPSTGIVFINSQYPEYISYSANSSNQLTISKRGLYNTKAANHSSSTNVQYYGQVNKNSYSNRSGKTQRFLNTQTQFDLSYYKNVNKIAYITAKIKWYEEGSDIKAKLLIHDETGETNSCYTFNLPVNLIEQNAIYTMISEIENNKMRIKLFKLSDAQQDTLYAFDNMKLIYDTGVVNNLFIRRRKGRIGWSCRLRDGDSKILSIRSHGLVYAKLLSTPMNSYTPVKGVQMSISDSPFWNLLTEVSESPFNNTTSKFEPEQKRVVAGSTESYRVINSAGALQGLSTNLFEIDDFEDIDISFSIYKSLDTQEISAALYDPVRDVLVPVYVPTFAANKWERVNLIFENEKHPAGRYQLLIVEMNAQSGSIWWADDIQINRHHIKWLGKSYLNGPTNTGADDWVGLNPVINNATGIASFWNSGKELQVQGLAKTQFAFLNDLNVVPRYATLGNFTKNE